MKFVLLQGIVVPSFMSIAYSNHLSARNLTSMGKTSTLTLTFCKKTLHFVKTLML